MTEQEIREKNLSQMVKDIFSPDTDTVSNAGMSIEIPESLKNRIKARIAELKATEAKEPQDFYAIATQIDELKNLLRQGQQAFDVRCADVMPDCQGEEGCLMCGS
jgi:predicted small metal-binding protein